MFRNSDVTKPPGQFVSAKTIRAIPIKHPTIMEALVQLSLDPDVISIDYIACTTVYSEIVDLDTIVIQGKTGRFILDVIPARPIRDLEDEGLVQIGLEGLNLSSQVITSEELRREPRKTNSKLVWSHNQENVPLDLAIRILSLLLKHNSMKLGKLLQRIRAGRRGYPSVMALACCDLLELDLNVNLLGPATLVRLRANDPSQRKLKKTPHQGFDDSLNARRL